MNIKLNLTDLGGEKWLIIQLILDPSHQVVDVLGRRAFDGLLNVGAVSPVVLISTGEEQVCLWRQTSVSRWKGAVSGPNRAQTAPGNTDFSVLILIWVVMWRCEQEVNPVRTHTVQAGETTQEVPSSKQRDTLYDLTLEITNRHGIQFTHSIPVKSHLHHPKSEASSVINQRLSVPEASLTGEPASSWRAFSEASMPLNWESTHVNVLYFFKRIIFMYLSIYMCFAHFLVSLPALVTFPLFENHVFRHTVKHFHSLQKNKLCDFRWIGFVKAQLDPEYFNITYK